MSIFLSIHWEIFIYAGTTFTVKAFEIVFQPSSISITIEWVPTSSGNLGAIIKVPVSKVIKLGSDAVPYSYADTDMASPSLSLIAGSV